MDSINNKPIEAPSFPMTVPNWALLVTVVHTQVASLTYAKEINHPFKKDVWRSVWKSAKALYYFYQNEAKPYTEENQPELAGAIQDVFEELNECLLDLKVLYRHASRNKLWAED